MSVEESPLLKEFKTFLQATLVAFGSCGAPFSLVNLRFSEDWVGSPSLKEYAAKLGFEGPKGIFKLLESIPDQVTVLVNPTGDIILKPVPMEETRDNLSKIDATNKELKAERMRRQHHQQGPLPAVVTAQMAAALMQCWPQVPEHPLASVFNSSIKRTSAAPTTVAFHPPPPTKKINPNLIPLGPPLFARCASASSIAGSSNGSGPSAPSWTPHPQQQQPQRVMTFFGQRKPQSAVVCNDFGDIVSAVSTEKTHDNSPKIDATNEEPKPVPMAETCDNLPKIDATNKHNKEPKAEGVRHQQHQQGPSKKINFEQAMRYMEREAWKRAEKRSDAYYEEDFRALATPRDGSPEPRPATQPQQEGVSKTAPKEENNVKEEPKEENKLKEESKEEIAKICEAEMVEDNVEDDYELYSDDSEFDWDFLDVVIDHDDWRDEDDNKECGAFLHKFSQTYGRPVPEDIYRLVHLFRQNGGSFHRMDMLEKKYSDTYGIRLNTSERNRLLGSPTATRIAKDSFSKAAYPGLFRISERMSNCYGANLLPCLAGNCVDPSVLWDGIKCYEQIDDERIDSVPSVQLAHFSGQKIECVLSAYVDLLDSLLELPLSPPFNVGKLVLFRHAKFGLCRGKVVRQDNQHLVVKHMDTQNEHYIDMGAIYAYPDHLLKSHPTTARPYSNMADHPGVQSLFVVPINEQKFRCF